MAAGEPFIELLLVNYSIVRSLVITTLSFDFPLASAMMMISTIIPATIHIQGWIIKLEEVVVVVDFVEETALSWANAIPSINSSRIITKNDE
jgi:hypothetical protein